MPGPMPPSGGRGSWRSLKNWRVRSRLLLLIIIPTLTAVILGGTYIVTSVQNAMAYQRVERLASLSYDVTGLAAHLEDERDQTMQYIGLGLGGRQGTHTNNTNEGAPGELATVTQTQDLTNTWLTKVTKESAAIGDSYPAQVQAEAQSMANVLQLVQPLRTAAIHTDLPAVDVMTRYTTIIRDLLAIDNNIALGSGDPSLNSDVRALNLVSLIAEEASEQRGLLAFAFAQDTKWDPAALTAAQQALEEQQANVAEFNSVATPQQVALYNNTVSGSLVSLASGYELEAIQYGVDGQSLDTVPTTTTGWYGAMSTGTVDDIRAVEQDLVAATISRAAMLHRNAITTAAVIGAAVLIVLLLALVLTTVVGRSMVRPLRRLRSGALEVAGVRLPETVRRMSDSDGAAVPLEVEPIDVDSSDEIGEVARAFDQVHREALRLAANEAALRGNVNAMFVNLSRRSQSLVERQIRLIDDLEQGEQDPDRLSSLFQMDHLATRMRRNSENLLVLAGHDASRRWNQPVALVDVLRAAVSEIEQYERVTLNVQPGIAVRGHAVNDVVHLLAELAENATSFSSAETPVVVAGHLLSSGGVLLDITDQGVGMGAEEMAHANWRLDNPPVVDVAVSRRMGLFVVARLAARHGIRVRLRPATGGGLTALVWLPDEVVSHGTDGGAPGMRRGDLSGAFGPAAASPSGLSAGAIAALPAGLNGEGLVSPAEQEINAARAPRFAGSEAESGSDVSIGLGPRRVPGAGPHPGSAGWGGAATTSPLPAFGSEAAEADLAVSSAELAEPAESMPGSFQPADAFFDGPAPVVDLSGPTVDFAAAQSGAQSAAPAQPLTLGEPAVVGRADAPAQPGTSGEHGFGSLGGPAGGTLHPLGGDGSAEREPAGFGWERGLVGATAPLSSDSSASAVVVPPAEHVAHENRLPIFEAVESDWFRRGRSGVPAGPAGPDAADHTVTQSLAVPSGSVSTEGMGGSAVSPDAIGGSWPDVPDAAGLEPEVRWAASAADEGWHAAEAASSPSTGGTTTAGLPKRVPQANLVPGTASPEAAAPVPARSAAATRDRFASFQRGIREGRAAASTDEGNSDEDDGSR
ncbi:MAG TPA: nitrate- and nitrite sensing domain-containing protein [Streptosporangiaceae bacterium]|nr:nitrate- and nitrite sensing domain-containing protein [Streptosporangiaceae bacterium]